MKHCLKSASLFAFAALFPAAHAATLDVFVDPAQTWWGYAAVYDLPADGGGFKFSEFYEADTAKLPGAFAGPVAWLAPSRIGVFQGDTQNPHFSFWWKADASGGYSANKIVENQLYVQNDSLAGNTLRFSGRTLTDTLTRPYTAYAFIAETLGDYYELTARQRCGAHGPALPCSANVDVLPAAPSGGATCKAASAASPQRYQSEPANRHQQPGRRLRNRADLDRAEGAQGRVG